jgi:hypothetical protein
MNQTTDRATAIFVARAILGTVFFVAGLYKTFMWGPVAHARELFVIPPPYTVKAHFSNEHVIEEVNHACNRNRTWLPARVRCCRVWPGPHL